MLLVRQLVAAGHSAEHVRDVGLGHEDDTVVFAYAQLHGLTIITIDRRVEQPPAVSSTTCRRCFGAAA